MGVTKKQSKQSKKDLKVKETVESSSSDSSSSSSSDSESDSSSSSSSDSESSSSDSYSESEEEEEVKETKKETKKESSSSSSDSDSSSSDSDSSSSDSESEEEVKETKKEVKKEAKKETKEESSSSSSESDSSSSDSDSSSDSSSSDSDSESESEEAEEEVKEEVKESKKRKSDSESASQEEKEESSSKKPKLAGEPATIFVGRLSWNIDGEWLKSEFEHIGGVISARVIYERDNAERSRGYGYVDFEDVSYAEKAIKEMQGKEIDGRPINVDMSTSKPAGGNNDRAKKFGDVPSEPSDTLFLGNLSFEANRDEIYEVFSNHGEIISVRLPTHPETEQPKGFGYVQYGSIESAQDALNTLQGHYINNRPVRLDFSTPKPRNDRGGNFGGRGGRGGNFGGRGGRGGSFGGRGGSFGGRDRGKGANSIPVGRAPQTASFQGSKKTFD
ncbi:hypothetical protein ACO0QE_002921 [Hanseniaspora vineae]